MQRIWRSRLDADNQCRETGELPAELAAPGPCAALSRLKLKHELRQTIGTTACILSTRQAARGRPTSPTGLSATCMLREQGRIASALAHDTACANACTRSWTAGVAGGELPMEFLRRVTSSGPWPLIGFEANSNLSTGR